jgi:hypothetical protein
MMKNLAGAAMAALLLAALGTGPSPARDVTDDERAALEETIADFGTATRALDMETVLGYLPPTMLSVMAAEFGLEVDALTAAMIEQSAEAMAAVTLVDFGMDMETARFAEDAAGEPYALIPTTTVVDAGSGKFRAVSDTLALLEEGEWYLLRVDPAQVELLKKAYPNLAGVTFDPGTMEAVTE